jgi:hypothetical protein
MKLGSRLSSAAGPNSVPSFPQANFPAPSARSREGKLRREKRESGETRNRESGETEGEEAEEEETHSSWWWT